MTLVPPSKRTKPHCSQTFYKDTAKKSKLQIFLYKYQKIFFLKTKLPISLPGVVGGIRLEVVSIEEVIDILFGKKYDRSNLAVAYLPVDSPLGYGLLAYSHHLSQIIKRVCPFRGSLHCRRLFSLLPGPVVNVPPGGQCHSLFSPERALAASSHPLTYALRTIFSDRLFPQKSCSYSRLSLALSSIVFFAVVSIIAEGFFRYCPGLLLMSRPVDNVILYFRPREPWQHPPCSFPSSSRTPQGPLRTIYPKSSCRWCFPRSALSFPSPHSCPQW